MTRSDRLKPIIKIAESREKEAARLLGQYQQMLDRHESKLGELLNYRKEYREQFIQVGTEGIDGAKMRDYQTFLQRLDIAIGQQKHVISQAIRVYEHQKQVWQQKRSRTQVLDKVVDRYRKDEEIEQGRKEQKQLDEHAQRRYHSSSETEDF